MIKFLKRLFSRKKHDRSKLVQILRGHCSRLMLERDECVFFNPIAGMFGPITMYGSINPSFEFQAFNYSRKEYMNVRVEISSPSRIHFYSSTADEGFTADTDKTHESLAFEFFNLISAYFPLMGGHKTKRKFPIEKKEAEPIKNVQAKNRKV